jgi:hypothetical protein
VGQAEEALHELVAAARGLVDPGVECIEPRAETATDVAKHLARDEGTADEEREAEDDPARAPGRHIDHHEEQPEVEQGGAEVPLEDEHDHRCEPDDEDGSEVPGARKPHPEHLAAHEREAVAGGDEIAGEKDGEGDLGEFARLEVERADADPQPRAVHGFADHGKHGQQKQRDAHEHRDVTVALQHAMVADEQDHGDRDEHGHRGPGDLAHTG